MNDKVATESETVQDFASEDLDLDTKLADVVVQELPIPEILQGITKATKVGEFFGWGKHTEESGLFAWTTVNRMPEEMLLKPITVFNPDQRKALVWAAIDLCMGIYKVASLRVHETSFDKNRAYVAGCRFILGRDNVWRVFDWSKGIGFVQNQGYVSPALQWKQNSINAIMGGQNIRITWEPDVRKQNLVLKMIAQLQAPLSVALANRETAFEVEQETRQAFNAAKRESGYGDARPEHIFIIIDEKLVDLMTVPFGTRFQLLSPEGKFMQNVTWRESEVKAGMFHIYANGAKQLKSGWQE